MRRIPDQRPLLVPEGEVHGKPRLCEATILADPDRRWQGWKVIAAIEATRELMADYPQRANRQALGSFFLDVAYFPGLAVLLIYKCASV